MQKARITKAVLKKYKVGGRELPVSKTYYVATIIKAVSIGKFVDK